jgi:endoglucanase Acf2
MTGRSRRLAALAVVVLLAGAGCGGGRSGTGSPTGQPGAMTPDGRITEAAGGNRIGAPAQSGRGSIAPKVPDAARPTGAPGQVGTAPDGTLGGGVALPTNQWWTSALTGPGSQPIWAHPLAVQVTGAGLAISSAPPVASANAVVTPFVPALRVDGDAAGVRVVGYGAFHVALQFNTRGGTARATLVQGSPLLYLTFTGTAPALTATSATPVTGSGTRVGVTVAGQRYDLIAGGNGHWRTSGAQYTVDGGDGRIAVARVPDGIQQSTWDSAISGAADAPVTGTTAAMSHDPATGTVTQTLTTQRTSGRDGVWALLPHQQAALLPGPTKLAGDYPDALGSLSLVDAGAIRIRVPAPGLLTSAPAIPLSQGERAAMLADLDQDLADPPVTGGSYFGLKELARLAGIAEVAGSIGAGTRRKAALDRLRTQIEDWLTYSGPGDPRYFGYEPSWGGLVAVPAEFGSNDYNDHHLQYGYLVRAAAVLGQADAGFVRDYGGVVDEIVRDYAGADSGVGSGGFPPFRVFNAYLGHSEASGFAPFADGNNQESSSEAVAAWEGVVRWGQVRGNPTLTTYGLTHYALEAATANRYWLGNGVSWPAGYAHRSAGIVWDAKLDYATFFDPKPESVQGIQLFPVTLGGLYRAQPGAARDRAAALAREVGGAPRVWGDVFAADLAAADPAAARQRLTPSLAREPSTSRALVRYLVDLLGAYGAPQPAVVADGPYGMAFGDAAHPTLLGTNPTGARVSVTFRRGGTAVGRLTLDPGQTASRR